MTCPPTATVSDASSKSVPAIANDDSVSSAARCSSASASGTCAEETTAAAGLMMPDLVRAISATVLPSRAMWSSAIGVKTAT